MGLTGSSVTRCAIAVLSEARGRDILAEEHSCLGLRRRIIDLIQRSQIDL